MPALTIQDLTVAYNQRPVLWRINAEIPYGVMLAIAGPNGAGKSTLIKAMAHLIKPLTGTITLLDRSYKEVQQRIAYIPQRSTVDWDFPITVLEVVIMGTYGSLGWCRRPGTQEYAQALHALDTLGMSEYAHTPINQLSGGQQQRMFIARALVQHADLYLMDEPFGGIDATTEHVILALMNSLRAQGKTIIVVHHDLHTISAHFDWVMLLNMQQIACGQRAAVLTHHHLVQAYGQSITQAHNFMETHARL